MAKAANTVLHTTDNGSLWKNQHIDCGPLVHIVWQRNRFSFWRRFRLNVPQHQNQPGIQLGHEQT